MVKGRFKSKFFMFHKKIENKKKMKRNNNSLFLLIFVFFFQIVSSQIEIRNCTALQEMMTGDSNVKYQLSEDIDCKGKNFISIGNDTEKFYGTLEGNGFGIKNLFINQSSSKNYSALFSYGSNCSVSNITLLNVSSNGVFYGAALFARCDYCSISNVNLSSSVIKNSSYSGGVVAYLYYGVLKKIVASKNIISPYFSESDSIFGSAVCAYGSNSNMSEIHADNNEISSDVGKFNAPICGYLFRGNLINATSINNTVSISGNGTVIYSSGVCGYLAAGNFLNILSSGNKVFCNSSTTYCSGVVSYNTISCSMENITSSRNTISSITYGPNCYYSLTSLI